LAKLDEAVAASRPLSTDDISVLRRQLAESQALASEQKDRLRQSHEESELLSRRKDELEARLSNLESEYEELLDKTIGDEERNSTETIQELKVRCIDDGVLSLVDSLALHA
jgi:kinesin family protein 5